MELWARERHYRGRDKRIPAPLKGLIALLLAGCIAFCALFGAMLLGGRDNIDGDPQVMIVLGCQVMDWGPSKLLNDRLEEALGYLEEHPAVTVVVSGGQGANEPTTEAYAMAEYLIEHGIGQERILLEETSSSTWENLQYSKRLLDEAGVDYTDGVLVVSNDFHILRAGLLAGRVGFDGVSTLAAPSSHLPSRLRMYVREPLALAKSLVFDR